MMPTEKACDSIGPLSGPKLSAGAPPTGGQRKMEAPRCNNFQETSSLVSFLLSLFLFPLDVYWRVFSSLPNQRLQHTCLALDMASPLLDVLIIGGGPAGLSVASGLARQIYSAVVFDNGTHPDARVTHMHSFAGWDHQSPADFRAKARGDLLEHYKTIQFEQTSVQRVRKTREGVFEAFDDQGRSWRGKKLVLANGAADVFPNIPGYEDCWGYGM